MAHIQEHTEHEHPSNRVYVLVAVILAVITAVEVMVFYVEALRPVIVPILLVLSAAKFTMVVGFFMHLKFDARLYKALFVGPLIISVAILLAMLLLFGAFTS